MTPQRANHILKNKKMGGDLRYAFTRRSDFAPRLYQDGVTRSEHEYVLTVWNKMPGYTCFADAMQRIAEGKA